MPIYYGQLARKITYTTTTKVQLRAVRGQGKPRFDRYQIHKRGMIARLLKPKKRISDKRGD